MSGDPSNAALWAEADVYIGDTDAVDPADADTEFGVDWDLVGLLDGDDGFTEARSEDTEDKFAWGGILVRSSRKNFKLTKTFSALEDNDTTRGLVWPGSDLGGPFKVPRPVRKRIAFETRDTSVDKVFRLISTYQAEITLNADIADNETDLKKFEFIATIFPNADGEIWTPQETGAAT